ncbi:hypothetical protein [Methyloterricola oryzae]|uniref:hypothetical protein n=1 Tax=Methyloterricola oryzae TaxID=1495050 RepID=UPI0005EBD733|nr:hypothetical protein [Methyloterricola oryzae]
MFRPHQTHNTATPGIFLWLVAGILSLFFSAFSAPTLAWDTVLFEDHFDNQDSLNNWGSQAGREWIEDGRFFFSACVGGAMACSHDWDAYATLQLDPQKNLEVSVKLHPMDVPEGMVIIREQSLSGVGKAYELRFSRVTESFPGEPIRYDHITLNRTDCLQPYPGGCYGSSSQAPTDVTFSPIDVPVTAQIRMEEGTLRVFLNGTQYLKFTDTNPLPPGSIRIGATEGGTRMTFDDFVVKALPDLRCSLDAMVDGKDQMCSGTFLNNPVWAYVWPACDIKKVDFYLDGRFHRTERYKPWEFDGGSASKLATGPHEIRAVVEFKHGGTKTLTSAFEVGKHSLRCSSDPVVDGKDPECEGSLTRGPQWVYWWPETAVKSVDFYVNSSQTKRTEYKAPFELVGGEPVTGNIWADDQFVRSVVRFRDGRKPLTVDTRFSTSHPLRCSQDPVLDGSGYDCLDINLPSDRPEWIYWWPPTGIASIDFYVDDVFYRTERQAPFELDDGAGTHLGLAPGQHTIRMMVTYKDRDEPVTVEQSVYVREE